ncbi:3459_t:CDS:2 [Gigaspora margarita]|uniref:3459_t:CDS:1 n=1 Tax=Gigaspora margarita TaxID=4874 RepID=A0ABN7VE67_GIGMA|nr:3459_t:CDS:2 [Gigaspora margarita]
MFLNKTEEALQKLKGEVNKLKTINQDLETQVEELKQQSAGIYTKSFAIVGVFARGA